MPSSSPASEAAEVLDTLLGERFSCRAFRPEPVPRDLLEQILGAAQHTPSWCNTQPWRTYLLSGEAAQGLGARLHALAEADTPAQPDFAFPARYAGVYRERRRACGLQLYDAVGIGREQPQRARAQALENFRLFGAPHLAILTTPQDLGVYGAVDCGLYLHALLLAARARGVDSIAQAALASYPEAIRGYLGLPAEERIVCGVALGYADAAHPINGYRTARAALGESVRFVDRSPAGDGT